MKKNFIKLNNNDEHLSLGNLIRLIKENSKNKLSAMQSEVFCILFEIESINDTTVNNYCVGCRSISGEYKQIYLNKVKKYKKNHEEFVSNIIGLLNIIDGNIYVVNNKISFINSNKSAIYLAKKLFNIAKNDNDVPDSLIDKISDFIHQNNYYDALVEEILFTILDKNQPLYESDLKKAVLENILNDTSISSNSLQEYLSLKLREGINYDYSLKKMASDGNAYANFELGTQEYYGYFKGVPRYDVAYTYLNKAASSGHPSANYMIGNMYLKGLLGKTNDELKKGYDYLVKAYDLGNIAACNAIGNMYYEGIYPLKKNIEKAIKYYQKASLSDYVFAFNNLGKIEEEKGNMKEAFEYFLKSANLGESWACNKVGEYYRQGLIKKDMHKAYYYYNKGIEANIKTLCYYNYYNLALYYYLNGYEDIACDEKKAIEYLKIASDNNLLDASIKLLSHYAYIFCKTHDYIYFDYMLLMKEHIETHEDYNEDICLKVEKILKEIKKRVRIDANLLEEIRKIHYNVN